MTSPVPLLDLSFETSAIRASFLKRVEKTLDRNDFVLGAEVVELERELGAFLGTPHGVACASGSDALLLALMAMKISTDDAVLTTPFSFFATASAVVRVGARLLFADIDPETFNLDPIAVEKLLTQKCVIENNVCRLKNGGKAVRALIVVHLYGQAANLPELLAIGKKWNIKIIEDSAQSLTTLVERHAGDGVKGTGVGSGTAGDFGCYSFYPTKNLGAMGDAGFIVCQNENDRQLLLKLRNHGQENRYEHPWVGINSRLDSLQAAALNCKIPFLKDWDARRMKNADLYRALFQQKGLAPHRLTPPSAPVYPRHHTFHQFVIRAHNRDSLKKFLDDRKIGNAIFYPRPLHLQPCFAPAGYRVGDFPEAERAAQEVLALPIHPAITADHIARVVEAIAEFYLHNS